MRCEKRERERERERDRIFMVLKEGMSESQKMNSYGAFFKKDKVARIQEVAAITTG